jgi:glycosyltransferase involved in cell wall biosynthesis
MDGITIGIPSYNEEGNITNLLKSIISSNINGNFIEKVIISDDSTDSTPQLVEDFVKRNQLQNIAFYHHGIRRGTAAAWNEIFNKASGSIIILFDADVIIDRNCISELVGSMAKYEQVGLCATNQIPIETRGISGKACSFIMEWLRSLRKKELSKYTVMGRALCIRSDITKILHIPEEVIAVDLYLQRSVMKMRLNVIYNDNAIVYFKPPTNLLEFSSQVIRARNGHKQVTNLPIELNLEPSLRSLLGSILSSIRSKPVQAAAAATSLLSVPYFSRKLDDTNNAKWDTSKSTKSIDYDEFISKQNMENNT